MPSALKKTLGIFCLLVVVFTFTAIKSPNFLSAYNLQNIIRWTSLFGIIAIGVTFPIITGGIDLSIGSVIGLIGCLLPSLLNERGWPLWAALTTVLALSALIGLAHGLLITKLHLQPFVVTLCGLLAYRSIARGVAHEATQGYGTGYLTFKHLVKDNLIQSITGRVPPFDLPNVSIFLIVIALLAAFF